MVIVQDASDGVRGPQWSEGARAPAWLASERPPPGGRIRDVTRTRRTTLVAAILGSGDRDGRRHMVNVALPAIEHDLGGGLQAQQWVANAYLSHSAR